MGPGAVFRYTLAILLPRPTSCATVRPTSNSSLIMGLSSVMKRDRWTALFMVLLAQHRTDQSRNGIVFGEDDVCAALGRRSIAQLGGRVKFGSQQLGEGHAAERCCNIDVTLEDLHYLDHMICVPSPCKTIAYLSISYLRFGSSASSRTQRATASCS